MSTTTAAAPAIDPAFAATLVETIEASVETIEKHAALVDAHGNLLPITGEVFSSSSMPGMVGIEVSHGTMYVEEGERLTVPSVHAIPLTKPVSPARLKRHYTRPGSERDSGDVTVSVLFDIDDLPGNIDEFDNEIQRLIVGNEWFGSMTDLGFAVTGHRDGKAIITVVANAMDIFSETLCTNFDDCGGTIDDGEGWDGECGDCADRTYAAENPDEDEDED